MSEIMHYCKDCKIAIHAPQEKKVIFCPKCRQKNTTLMHMSKAEWESLPEGHREKILDDFVGFMRYRGIKEYVVDDLLTTTGPSLEGYRVLEYKKIVSSEFVIPNGILGLVTHGTFFTISSMTKAREMALHGIKELAYDCGANAVISVDLDVNDLGGNGIMVSANGTAVKVVKITD